MATPLSGRGEGAGPLGQPLDDTVVVGEVPGLDAIHKLASPSPPFSFWLPSLATDSDVSPGPSMPRTSVASAMTCSTRSPAVVGTVSLSPVRPFVDTSRTTSPSAPDCATPVSRIADTASSFAPSYGLATTIVFGPGLGFSQ